MPEIRTGDSANLADPTDLTCWDCGFESRRRHGYFSLLSVVCCQVEVSVTADPSSRTVIPCVCVCVCVCLYTYTKQEHRCQNKKERKKEREEERSC